MLKRPKQLTPHWQPTTSMAFFQGLSPKSSQWNHNGYLSTQPQKTAPRSLSISHPTQDPPGPPTTTENGPKKTTTSTKSPQPTGSNCQNHHHRKGNRTWIGDTAIERNVCVTVCVNASVCWRNGDGDADAPQTIPLPSPSSSHGLVPHSTPPVPHGMGR